MSPIIIFSFGILVGLTIAIASPRIANYYEERKEKKLSIIRAETDRVAKEAEKQAAKKAKEARAEEEAELQAQIQAETEALNRWKLLN